MKSQKKDTETELSKLNHNNKSSTKKKGELEILLLKIS